VSHPNRGTFFRTGFTAVKSFDGFGAENRASAAEHGVRKDGSIFGSGKQASVSSHAAQDAGIFVLYFAFDDAAGSLLVGDEEGDAALADKSVAYIHRR